MESSDQDDTEASDQEPGTDSSDEGDHGNMPVLEWQADSESEPEDDEWSGPKAVFKYKKVAQKVRPQCMIMPEHMKTRRQFPNDPLQNLPRLPYHPPKFIPSAKITQERMDELAIEEHEELLPEERKLLQHILLLNERSIAFNEEERGTFKRSYFSDYIIPTVEHTPWIEKNIPLPQHSKDDIIRLLQEKVKAGVYEPTSTAYRSKWFCVKKKDGGFRMVHDLQNLNSVTIQDSAVPPIVEEFVESYAGRSVYSVLDMYWGFHARMIDPSTRDMTAFQTPLGAFRLTSLPMGFTNAPAEFQACMMFILQDEVPDVAGVFIDDIPIKGPPTRYLTPDGKEEVLSQNPGIRRYMWEHINDVHRILHRLGEAGGTISAKKMQLCRSEVVIVGHKCSAKGRSPVDERIQKIQNWPIPRNLKEIRGFLGLCGTVRIWIKDYSIIAKPLVDLTRKGTAFSWGPDQDKAFNHLKELVTKAPALRPIDYSSNRPIILSVDTSIYGIGFILSQEDEQGRRAPARYGSLPINETEAHYPQSKLELYGLFRALQRYSTHITGVKELIVEVDASSIAGMIDKMDVKTEYVMARWVEGILHFHPKIVHVPGNKHLGPDALSRRRFTSDEEKEAEGIDPIEWLDNIAFTAKVHKARKDSSSDTTDSNPDNHHSSPLSSILHRTELQDLRACSSTEGIVNHKYNEEDLAMILRYLTTNKFPEFRTKHEGICSEAKSNHSTYRVSTCTNVALTISIKSSSSQSSDGERYYGKCTKG